MYSNKDILFFLSTCYHGRWLLNCILKTSRMVPLFFSLEDAASVTIHQNPGQFSTLPQAILNQAQGRGCVFLDHVYKEFLLRRAEIEFAFVYASANRVHRCVSEFMQWFPLLQWLHTWWNSQICCTLILRIVIFKLLATVFPREVKPSPSLPLRDRTSLGSYYTEPFFLYYITFSLFLL